jgi:hypothetical protein
LFERRLGGVIDFTFFDSIIMSVLHFLFSWYLMSAPFALSQNNKKI